MKNNFEIEYIITWISISKLVETNGFIKKNHMLILLSLYSETGMMMKTLIQY